VTGGGTNDAADVLPLMKLRVLVADDDPDLLSVVAAALIHVGADVVRATTGIELLEGLAEQGPFDLLITDVSMPWMTGLQAAHTARAAGLDIPTIVMTGLTESQVRDRFEALGDNAILLRKPFDCDDLETAVNALLPNEALAKA